MTELKKRTTAPPAEPVNSAQLAAGPEKPVRPAAPKKVAAKPVKAAAKPPAPAPNPELDEAEQAEAAALAAEHTEGLERENDDLRAELEELKAQVRLLSKDRKAAAARVVAGKPTTAAFDTEDGEEPVFDEELLHGLVYGDARIAYVQNGHLFARDKSYLGTEEHRGVGKPFNPRMVGVVKPRRGQAASDSLDGFRDSAG